MQLAELKKYQLAIHPVLVSFFSRQERALRRVAPTLLPLESQAADFVLRKSSKRLRGFLITVGYQLIARQAVKSIIDTSIIAELIHASLLIHDDIIDRDEIRRGGPTVHVALSRLSPRQSNARHFGISQGLLLGNLMGIWARQLVLAGPWPKDRKLKALTVVERMMASTHLGQMLDVSLTEQGSARAAQVVMVHQLKTADYSFIGPLQIGAVLAGASERQLEILRRYALPTGLAFQIQDDILGLFGNVKETGKPVGADLAEGKKTLLIIEALRRSQGRARVRLQRILKHRAHARSDLAFVRTVVRSSGALEANRRLAATLVKQAQQVLARARQLDKESCNMLSSLSEFTIHRPV